MFEMFNQPPHDTATRKRFLGISEETTPLSDTKMKLFQNIDGILKQCGGGLAPQVAVTEMKSEGGTFIETDKYTITRPGQGR